MATGSLAAGYEGEKRKRRIHEAVIRCRGAIHDLRRRPILTIHDFQNRPVKVIHELCGGVGFAIHEKGEKDCGNAGVRECGRGEELRERGRGGRRPGEP